MQNLPEKLDEFGRDENMELREEIEQRANKRAARYAQVPAQQSQVLTFCIAWCTCWLRLLILVLIISPCPVLTASDDTVDCSFCDMHSRRDKSV